MKKSKSIKREHVLAIMNSALKNYSGYSELHKLDITHLKWDIAYINQRPEQLTWQLELDYYHLLLYWVMK